MEPAKSVEYRTAFQRDYDRILYSPHLARLAVTTQVVSAQEGHLFHNRLRHTLEVAQVARRLAERFAKEHNTDPDVVEAAAMALDLGHPPFGHAGEHALDEIMRELVPESDGYEGNAQSFRILTDLAVHSKKFRGLNLTARTLHACLKYPWMRDLSNPDSKKHRKFGVYLADIAPWDWLTAKSGTLAKSLEAEIMDFADDIAYSVHDLFDFYRAGLIPLDEYVDSPDRFDALVARAASGPKGHVPKRGAVDRFKDEVLHLLPFVSAYRPSRKADTQLRESASVLIGRYCHGAEIQAGRLVIPDLHQGEIEFLKLLTRFHVFRSPALQAAQFGHRRILRGVVEILWHDRDLWTNLPHPSGEPLAKDKDDLIRIREIADYISGLSESEVYRLYSRLTGQSPASLFAGYV